MAKLFLFESGSTKTNLLVCTIGMDESNTISDLTEFKLAGYNPNRKSTALLEEVKQLSIHKGDHVFFYGSGLGSVESKAQLSAHFLRIHNIEISVYDDVLGAARALYQNDNGVFAIMGTGGLAGYYNGVEVENRKGGYGYLIDDLGGGYELGKRVVSAWLNDELPSNLQTEIEELFELDRSTFVRTYYQDPKLGYNAIGLGMIADTVRLIEPYKSDHKLMLLLEGYIADFFRIHVAPLFADVDEKILKITGSIAEVFKDSIQKVALQFGFLIKQTLRYPAYKLVEYHFNAIRVEK